MIEDITMKITEKYHINSITYDQCKEWLIYKHYAKRMSAISYSYGLYDNVNILQGVLTIGIPTSNALTEGICGVKNKKYVLELNRLVVNDGLPKNVLSYFVASVLRVLPKMILISYADTSMNHNGYIYQATNWIYTGLSAKRPEWKDLENPNRHNRDVANVPLIERKTNSRYKMIERPRKHRYIYFIGDRRDVREFNKSLNYKIEKYPKGKNKRYDSSYKPEVQGKLF